MEKDYFFEIFKGQNWETSVEIKKNILYILRLITETSWTSFALKSKTFHINIKLLIFDCKQGKTFGNCTPPGEINIRDKKPEELWHKGSEGNDWLR